MDSFRPALSFERRDDDLKMFLLRLVSAVSLTFFMFQLAKDPENLDSLSSFTNDSMNDFFNWGNDRFVLGQLPSSGNSTGIRRKKSPQEIFMEAILEDEEDTSSKGVVEDAPDAETSANTTDTEE